MSEEWAGFDEVAATGVEVGTDALAPEPVVKEEAPQTEPEVAVEAPETEASDEEATEDEQPKKGGKPDKDQQINRLKREKAEEKARAAALEDRLKALEERLTPAPKADTQPADTAPNPHDFEKYPLGTLDPGYLKDVTDYAIEQKMAERATADLHRRQEEDRQTSVLTTVDKFVTSGEAIDAQYREKVVETAFRGDWALSEETFEAAKEADNGARILYDLSQNPEEALRVANLSPIKQAMYVAKKDAEIGAAPKARTAPQAGEPPKHLTRGANSRVKDNPATDDLDDFGRQFDAA